MDLGHSDSDSEDNNLLMDFVMKKDITSSNSGHHLTHAISKNKPKGKNMAAPNINLNNKKKGGGTYIHSSLTMDSKMRSKLHKKF